MPGLFLHLKYQRVPGSQIHKRDKFLHVQDISWEQQTLIPLERPKLTILSTTSFCIVENMLQYIISGLEVKATWTQAEYSTLLILFKMSVQIGSSFWKCLLVHGHHCLYGTNGLDASVRQKQRNSDYRKSEDRDNWKRSGEEELLLESLHFGENYRACNLWMHRRMWWRWIKRAFKIHCRFPFRE